MSRGRAWAAMRGRMRCMGFSPRWGVIRVILDQNDPIKGRGLVWAVK
jgi:hypothetical protein